MEQTTTRRARIVEQFGDDLIVLAGHTNYDEAILGVADGRVVYDAEKILAILEQDMSPDDALEFFDYNIAGLKGDGMPIYLEFVTPSTD